MAHFTRTAVLLFTLSLLLRANGGTGGDSLTNYYLDNVVITANRVPTPAAEIGSSYTVITREQLLRSGKTLLLQMLDGQPGLHVPQQGGPGKLASLYTRGGSASYTLVLIDGIKMNMANDPGNIFDFSTLTVDNIERIEVLRGPQSTLYGSEAITGVVNIITRKTGLTPGITLSTEAGSYNTIRGSASLRGNAGKYSYEINANRFSTKGFSSAGEKYGNTEKDGSGFTSYSARASRVLREGEVVSVSLMHGKGSADFDQYGGKFGDDPTYYYNFEETGGSINYQYSPEEAPLHLSAGVSMNRNIRWYGFSPSTYTTAESRSWYNGDVSRGGAQVTWFASAEHTVTAGVEFERQQAASDYFYDSKSPSGTYVSVFPMNYSYSAGVYAQEQFRLYNTLFITAGARLEGHRDFGWTGTFRTAASYVFWQTGIKLKATAASAFKAPSLFYLYDPFFGNRDLNPERNFGWDAGIETPIAGAAVAELTWFNNRFTNLFGYDALFRTMNINSARTYGAEAAVTSASAAGLTVKAAYTFTASTDHSAGADYRKPLLRRPKHKGNIELNFNGIHEVNINLNLLLCGARDEKDFSVFPAVRFSAPGYAVVNAAVQWEAAGFATLFARCENLLNKDYEEIPGYGTAGRSIYGGIRLGM